MSEFGDSVGFFLSVLVYGFSWAIGLAVAARYVFGSTKRVAVCWFLAGFVINMVAACLITMEISSYLPEWSNTWSKNDYRLRRLHKGFVAIPSLAVAIGTAYAAYRRMMLNRAPDAG